MESTADDLPLGVIADWLEELEEGASDERIRTHLRVTRPKYRQVLEASFAQGLHRPRDAQDELAAPKLTPDEIRFCRSR